MEMLDAWSSEATQDTVQKFSPDNATLLDLDLGPCAYLRTVSNFQKRGPWTVMWWLVIINVPMQLQCGIFL